MIASSVSPRSSQFSFLPTFLSLTPAHPTPAPAIYFSDSRSHRGDWNYCTNVYTNALVRLICYRLIPERVVTELVNWSCPNWPCDCGCLRSASRERTLSSIRAPVFVFLFQKLLIFQKPIVVDSSMAADAHGPNPKVLLCNAGAGAAAGKFSSPFLLLFLWSTLYVLHNY